MTLRMQNGKSIFTYPLEETGPTRLSHLTSLRDGE